MKAFRIPQRITLFLFIILAAVACKKDLETIGLDLVSPGDLISLGYSDTLSIEAFSVGEDSVRTLNLSYAVVGSMNDPVFGRTDAEWYSQIRLAEEPTEFGTNPVFDSAFLIMPFSDAYGDTLSNMTVKVYSLTEDIIDSVHIYSNHSVTYDVNTPIGELTFTPRAHDSSYYSGATHAPALRIPLNQAFGQKILSADTSYLATNDDFIEFYKGLAMVAEQPGGVGKGAMLKLTVSAGSSKILMYYHNSTDTTSYTFGINSDCSRFNHFDHMSYSGASPILTQQIQGDSAIGEQFLFVQTMGGIRVKLKFPGLKQWSNSQKILINDAQLIVKDALPSSVFTPPASLFLYPVASDGTLYPYQLPDADEGSSYFDGTYNSTNGTYRFRLSHYVQQVLNGQQTDYGLFLVIPAASVNSSRIVLGGPKNAGSAIKMYIKYTVVQ
ncbi:MAG: DUF4270 domain-containing protein [Bacteroidales bacterium]|nr:DUF4270 domain-containing protein [Bacteroidales bacterium]